jgi:hypothetical protein
MNTYWFDIEVAGPVTEEHTEALADRLATRNGIDATVQADHHGGAVMFSREADDAIQAIVSAIEDVEAAGMTATGVTEDRVTVEDIAERAGVTVTAVRYWISGGRGPGGFPQPKVARSRFRSRWLPVRVLGLVHGHEANQCLRRPRRPCIDQRGGGAARRPRSGDPARGGQAGRPGRPDVG